MNDTFPVTGEPERDDQEQVQPGTPAEPTDESQRRAKTDEELEEEERRRRGQS